LTQGENVKFRIIPVGKGAGDPCGISIGVGSDDEDTPNCDDNYWCLLGYFTPTVLSISCKERGGTAELCGFSEFTTPSDPPKKYRQYGAAGTLCDDDKVYAPDRSLSCSLGSVANSSLETFSGVHSFDPVTCVQDPQLQRCIKVSGAAVPCASISISPGDCSTFFPTGFGSEFGSPPFYGGIAMDYSVSPTSQAWTMIGPCTLIGSPGSEVGRTITGVVGVTLLDEDTEEDANARLLATLLDWEDIDPVECSVLPCCEAIYTKREEPDPFEWSYQEARCDLHIEGLTAGGFAAIRAHIWKTDHDTLISSEHSILQFETYADGFGGADFAFELPIERGFTTYIKKFEFRRLV
jgi:hypothetical protein